MLVSTRVYHDIPTSGTGSAGTNYNETTYGFDSMERQNRTRSPGGTITRTVFDVRSNPISVYVGTDDTGATESDPTGGGAQGNTMKLVAEYEYDDGVGCGCGPGLTGGNLTEEVQHLDASTWRTTQHLFDWRNRRTHTLLPADDQNRLTFSKNTFDNLDRAVKVERYHDTASDGVDPDGEQNPDDVLIARQETFYDELGRVYRTKSYAVDASDGTVGNALVANMWFDAAGNTIKQQSAASQGFTKTVYDGLGRAVKQYVGYDTDETSYADAGAVSGDTILEQTENSYDAAGNVTLLTARQRLHTATGTGELTSPSGSQPKARVSYVGHWYDELGRHKATANYGTNGGSALTRPATVPARSDDVLVTTTTYNDRGEAYAMTDPAGRDDRQEFDDAGRVVRTIQNYVDGTVDGQYPEEDVTVETTYSSDGQMLTLVAKNPTTGDQTTRYVYGTTLADSTIARSDLLRAVIYPDSDDTANPLGDGADGVYDRVELKYNRQGEVTERKDQNGTVHQYLHDALGRRTADKVTSLGASVDGAVRRIERSYEVRGMLEKTTSYDAPTGGNAVNQVVFEFDSTGALTKEYQEHGGLKGVSTPYAGYGYDLSAAGGEFLKGLRPASLRYPNGRLIHYAYGTAGETGDAVRRVVSIRADSGGSPGDPLAEYSYLGLGSIVQVDYPEADLRYDLAHGAGDDPYDGVDRFGRAADVLWRDYGSASDAERIKHGYDRASNRLWREALVAAGNSVNLDELYGYDGVYRLRTFDRGDLNATKNGLVAGTKTLAQQWSLDATGNWSRFQEDADGSGTWELDQSRSHNKTNEITQVAGSGTHVAYDRAGNMTRVPKPGDWSAHYDLVYDGWNRLVKVLDGAATVAEYAYDGRFFRVKKTISGTVRHEYYNAAWQCLEERLGSSSDAERQFVWGLRYVDDLLLRDRDTSVPADGTLDERLYAMQDANWNVTAVADSTGTVQERYAYRAYGRSAVLTASHGARATSSYDWEYRFTGRRLDDECGFYHYRARCYVPEIGRFANRDPLSYGAGINLYSYVLGNPVGYTDPWGLDVLAPPRPAAKPGPKYPELPGRSRPFPLRRLPPRPIPFEPEPGFWPAAQSVGKWCLKRVGGAIAIILCDPTPLGDAEWRPPRPPVPPPTTGEDCNPCDRDHPELRKCEELIADSQLTGYAWRYGSASQGCIFCNNRDKRYKAANASRNIYDQECVPQSARGVGSTKTHYSCQLKGQRGQLGDSCMTCSCCVIEGERGVPRNVFKCAPKREDRDEPGWDDDGYERPPDGLLFE